MARQKARSNPDILRWARDEAGFSLPVAAAKIGISSSTLEWWEEGADEPTIPQLRKVAEAYKRPLATFFLSDVPKSFRVTSDFRRLPGEVAGVYSPELRLELREAMYHRDVALTLLDELDESVPQFEFTSSVGETSDAVGSALRTYLGIDNRRGREPRETFNHWRRQAESRGILVFQLSRVSTAEMRGFSLSQFPLPVVAVNRKDAWAGRTFSLVHELVHIALNQGGLCDISDARQRSVEQQRVETFCNRVAGAALIPADALLAYASVKAHLSKVWDFSTLQKIARSFGVSKEAVLRRLLTLGRTTEAFYQEARVRFEEEYEILRLRELAEIDEFARNMPQETVGLLGRRFIDLVLETYGQDRITLNDVSTYLGVRVRHVPGIEAIIRAS
jgi:Zn-dependent peptidase ImmA (M78 family)/DNA-binding XRE family transcriptional regulator